MRAVDWTKLCEGRAHPAIPCWSRMSAFCTAAKRYCAAAGVLIPPDSQAVACYPCAERMSCLGCRPTFQYHAAKGSEEPKVVGAAWCPNGSDAAQSEHYRIASSDQSAALGRSCFPDEKADPVWRQWPELLTVNSRVDRKLSCMVDFNPPRPRRCCQPRGAVRKPSRKCPLWRLVGPCTLPLCCGLADVS